MRTYLFTLGIFTLLGCTAPAFASSVSVCDAVAGNLVQNCGFETGDFSGWTVLNNDGNTLVEATSFQQGANSGNFFAALGDAAITPTTLAQTFTDTVGSTLTFSFYLATDGQPDQFTAEWNGVSELSLLNATAQGYTQYSFTLTATGSDTISFIERNPLGFDALDDVAVVESQATPEPSSLSLAAAAIGLIALAQRRRAKKIG
jgi:hypothetical protein